MKKAKRGYNAKRVYAVRCDSGLIGWRTRLQNNYANFDDWEFNSDMWGLIDRLDGFSTPREAWEGNPIIQGGSQPGDFRCA